MPLKNELRYKNSNLVMQLGEETNCVIWSFTVKKTWLNRFKYWIFFKFFPFRLVSWEKLI